MDLFLIDCALTLISNMKTYSSNFDGKMENLKGLLHKEGPAAAVLEQTLFEVGLENIIYKRVWAIIDAGTNAVEIDNVNLLN